MPASTVTFTIEGKPRSIRVGTADGDKAKAIVQKMYPKGDGFTTAPAQDAAATHAHTDAVATRQAEKAKAANPQ